MLGRPRASVPTCWVLPRVVQAGSLSSEANMIQPTRATEKTPGVQVPALISSVTSNKSFYLLETFSLNEKYN